MDTVVKERPILFSGAMVRALLAGTKTQTRRAIKHIGIGSVSRKPIPVPEYTGRFVNSAGSNLWAPFGSGEARPDGAQNTVNTMRGGWFPCPYGQPGDRLWVRETWGFTAKWPHGFQRQHIDNGGPWLPEAMAYRANAPEGNWDWRPSIFMPRWASRILLEIVAVRVERVQDISEADAVAEGILPYYFYPCNAIERASVQPPKGDGEKMQLGWANYYPKGDECRYLPAADSYRTLWQSINGPESWTANPWVWVVEFKVIAGGSIPILPTSRKEATNA